jgi:DNA-binding CsgD family transcriptional regulator
MKEKIIELRKRGYTYKQIINELGCSKSTISFHLNNIGLGEGYSDRNIVNRIEKLRKLGKTYKEIQSVIDISIDRLKKICRELDLNKPTNVLHTPKNDENLKNEIINFYKKTKSLRKTSKEFKLDRTTLRKKFILDDDVIIRKKQTNEEKKHNSVKSVVAWRQRVKLKLIKYKGGKCEKCGYDKCNQALQFHHKNPKEKDFTVSGKSYSFEKMKNEVDKCMILCANCHIEEHHL